MSYPIEADVFHQLEKEFKLLPAFTEIGGKRKYKIEKERQMAAAVNRHAVLLMVASARYAEVPTRSELEQYVRAQMKTQFGTLATLFWIIRIIQWVRFIHKYLSNQKT